MSLLSSIRSLFGEHPPRIPPGFASGGDSFDSEEMQSFMPAPATAASFEGVRLAILYADGTGAYSRRVVQVRSIQSRGSDQYLFGWCELRSAVRSFRVSRIEEITDMRTGEISDDPQAYLAPLLRFGKPAAAPRRRSAAGNAPRKRRRDPTEWLMAETYDGLLVLLYFATADERLHQNERDVLWRYLEWQQDRCSIEGRPDRHVIDAFIDLISPTTEEFAEAVERLVDSERIHAQFVLDRVPDIINADGEADEEERRRWNQIIELLGNRASVH